MQDGVEWSNKHVLCMYFVLILYCSNKMSSGTMGVCKYIRTKNLSLLLLHLHLHCALHIRCIDDSDSPHECI